MSDLQLKCSKHAKTITNYCYSQRCLKPLCPECIESHIKSHAAKSTLPEIQTVQSSAARCQKKLKLALEFLADEFKPLQHKQEAGGLAEELERLRQRMHAAVDRTFNELAKNCGGPNEFNEFVKKSSQEIEQLLTNLRSQDTCLEAIKKTFSLELDLLWSTIAEKRQKRPNFVLPVVLCEELQSVLRRMVSEVNFLQEIKPAKQNHHHVKTQPNAAKMQPLADPPSKTKIVQPTGPQCNFLHYLSAPNQLYVLALPGDRFVKYSLKLEVPSFCKSVAVGTDHWMVIMMGGSNIGKGKRHSQIYKITEGKTTLVAHLAVPRSSFGCTRVGSQVYIVGGFDSGNQVINSTECYDIETDSVHTLSKCKVACFNVALSALGNGQLIKVGGAVGPDRLANAVEVYSIPQNRWTLVQPQCDPRSTVSPPLLLSSMGIAQLEEGSVIVFGGYDEERDNQPSKCCFVILEKAPKDLVFCRQRDFLLPLQEGFWGESVVNQGRVWALQNIADDDCSEIISDQRRILQFDGSAWHTLKDPE